MNVIQLAQGALIIDVDKVAGGLDAFTTTDHLRHHVEFLLRDSVTLMAGCLEFAARRRLATLEVVVCVSRPE